MNFDKFFAIASALVAVAAITTIVSHAESANVIKAMGTAFSGSIRAAIGK